MGEIIDPLNQLLNTISYKLTQENLQSLIHICGKYIPEGKKDSIQNGLTLFKYLLQEDLINRRVEGVANLRKLMRKMLPKRRDIVRLVDEYIKKEYHTNDVRSVLQDLSDSYEQFNNCACPFDDDVSDTNSAELCNIDNKYMYCGCRLLPSCYFFLIIVLSFSIIGTSLFWYADVPKIHTYMNNDEDLKKGGKYIIIAECLLLCLVVMCFLWKKFKPSRRGYVAFVNPSVQAESAGERIITNPGPVNTPVLPLVEPSKEERVVSASRAYNNNGSASSPDTVGASVSSAEVVE